MPINTDLPTDATAAPSLPAGWLDGHLIRVLAAGRSSDRDRAKEVEPYRGFLDALGIAVYTTDVDGRITFFNQAAAGFWGRRPELGEEWCGSWRLFTKDGLPIRHDECPMAVAIKGNRPIQGEEAMAERPDGTRVSFLAYPTPLEDANGDLVGAVNVLVDVTGKRRAEETLRSVAAELAASNAVKDEFLGLVSHELRTPVTTIFGNAQLLAERGERLDPATRTAMVADIAADADRLLGVVENLLLHTRLGSGALPDVEPEVLGYVVHGAVESFRRRHPDRAIVVDEVPRHVIVEADRTYVELLVENLLGNAAKYSPADTTIEVRVCVEAHEVSLVVLDRGIGFEGAEDVVDEIFEPFFRLPTARSTANGVGIGLAVCKRITTALGGRIWAAPRHGGGAEVGFALPLVSPDADRTRRASLTETAPAA
ncbi:MAG: ATP-binding protein [Chloroflexota bacterium]